MNLYSKRRELLAKNLEQNSVVVIFSSDVEFEQGRFNINRNFYYLTGLDYESMILVIFNRNGQISEHLFIPPFDKEQARWVGGRILKDEASEISDVKDVLELSSFISR